jgi:hypothetical protein
MAFHGSGSKSERNKALEELTKIFIKADPCDFEIIERGTGSLGASRNPDIVAQEITAKGQAVLKIREEQNQKIQAQAERIAEFEARIVELEAAHTEPAAASDTGEEYIPWTKFEAAAISSFGREGSWKAVVAMELDIDIKTLNAWQTVGLFPARYRDAVKTFTDDQKAPSSRQRWTDDEYDRLEALIGEMGNRNREIAEILRAEFGRRLTESSITGARRRIRNR